MSYIGLDVGGTNVRYGFSDSLDSIDLNCQKKPFVKIGIPHKEVEENICSIIDMTPGGVEGIGISLAAIMDRKTGKVKTWSNNPCWNHYELIKYLSDRYNIPIVVEDDANCGAIGEYYSLSIPVKNMAYITIGTGIGCGLILNGSLFIGENGFAGELGHVCIDSKTNDSICSCGNKGCFQSLASGPAVLEEYNMTAKARLESLKEVIELDEGKNLKSICLSNMISNISIVIYNLVMCLDISMFVIGGGVSNIGSKFISNIENKVKSRLKPFERSVLIRKSWLGEYSGVHGALQLLKDGLYKGDRYAKENCYYKRP